MSDLIEPADAPFTVYQGQDWWATFELYLDTNFTVPMDLTGFEIDMYWAEGVADSGVTPVFKATTRTGEEGEGRITIRSRNSAGEVDPDGAPVPSQGVFKVECPAAVSAAIAPSKGVKPGGFRNAVFFHNVELTDPLGRTSRPMQGKITFSLEVTRRTP